MGFFILCPDVVVWYFRDLMLLFQHWATWVFGTAPAAWSRGRINKLQQALHENNTDQFNIDAKEWRA